MDLAERFAYPQEPPFDIRPAGQRQDEHTSLRNFTYASLAGGRRAAYLISPVGPGPYPAVLYVHWYESEAATSNRRQFVAEAQAMAARGVVALLVETMWSDVDWFIKRTQADDEANTISEVRELRRALDLLAAEPQVDASRLALVGHDFGGMHGVLLGRVDPRPGAYVVMASTPRFADWYLYYPPLAAAEQEQFRQLMAPYDPIAHVAALAPAPILFQFAHEDRHVPEERANAFFAAAAEPKSIRWHGGGHALDEAASSERMAWLAAHFGLGE